MNLEYAFGKSENEGEMRPYILIIFTLFVLKSTIITCSGQDIGIPATIIFNDSSWTQAEIFHYHANTFSYRNDNWPEDSIIFVDNNEFDVVIFDHQHYKVKIKGTTESNFKQMEGVLTNVSDSTITLKPDRSIDYDEIDEITFKERRREKVIFALSTTTLGTLVGLLIKNEDGDRMFIEGGLSGALFGGYMIVNSNNRKKNLIINGSKEQFDYYREIMILYLK